jgi:hypothetical protein
MSVQSGVLGQKAARPDHTGTKTALDFAGCFGLTALYSLRMSGEVEERRLCSGIFLTKFVKT